MHPVPLLFVPTSTASQRWSVATFRALMRQANDAGGFGKHGRAFIAFLDETPDEAIAEELRLRDGPSVAQIMYERCAVAALAGKARSAERKKRHQDRAPDDKPAHRAAVVTWKEGLPTVREGCAKGLTLKAALREADLLLNIVGNSTKQPIRNTDGGEPDHSRALDAWYRRALKAEKAESTEAGSVNS